MAIQIRFGILKDAVQVKDSGGTVINPASEATLQQLLAKIDKEVANETPAGAIDGSNKQFATAYVYKTGTTKLYLNTLRQFEGVDYVEDVGRQSVTFTTAPVSGDAILVDYVKE